MKEKDLLFFQPLWRRIAVTLFCAGWAGWEWLNGQTLWGVIITGVTLYCYWTLFHTFVPIERQDKKG